MINYKDIDYKNKKILNIGAFNNNSNTTLNNKKDIKNFLGDFLQ